MFSDALWERLLPVLPVHTPKVHPLGCHRPRVPDRDVLNAVFFVLRMGCQWKALDAMGLCMGSTAHSRFQQGVQADVFARLWGEALTDYDDLIGLDFASTARSTRRRWAGKKRASTPRTAAEAALSAAC